MGEETILESIFFDREQRVLANVSDEEKNVILEIKSIWKREKSKEPAGTIKVKKLDGWSSYYGGLVIWLV